MNKKMVIATILVLMCLFGFGGCGSVSPKADDDKSVDDSVVSDAPAIAESEEITLSPMELLEQKTGYRYMDYLFWDLDNWYTVTLQRELVGNTFLIREYFDIFETNGQLYLTAADYYYDLYIIKLTEEQYSKICSMGRTRVPLSFRMDSVSPLPITFIPEYEYETKEVSFYDEDYEEYRDEYFVDEDTIYAYIESSPRYKIIRGTLIDIYELD